MTVTIGSLQVKCPDTKVVVAIHKVCQGANPCPKFKHFAIQGNRVAVTCDGE